MDMFIGYVVQGVPYLWTRDQRGSDKRPRFSRIYLVTDKYPQSWGHLLPPQLLGKMSRFFRVQSTVVPRERFPDVRLNGDRVEIENLKELAVSDLLTQLHLPLERPSISEFVFLRPRQDFPRLLVTPDRAFLKSSFPPVRHYGKLQLTDVGIYSVTRWKDARLIGTAIQNFIGRALGDWSITETCGGVGGDALEFSCRFGHVTAVELIPVHCAVLEHNIQIYRRASRVRVVCANYVDVCGFFRPWKGLPVVQQVVYFDPPWGGAYLWTTRTSASDFGWATRKHVSSSFVPPEAGTLRVR